ncbi:MAG TPA: hypothetical protein VFG50_16155 [Rhodothermales bacterium]|nr:hypothetical protein [Rhodothermales bacterium]
MSFLRISSSLLVLSLWAAGSVAVAQDRDSTAAVDSLLIKELEKEMAGQAAATPTPTPAQAAPRSAPTTNPRISVIGDLRAWYTSEGERNVDAELHEAELSFQSVVDPYARADVFVAADHGPGGFHFDLEEAYLTTLSLPHQLQLKGGKFRSTVGKINRIHPHALPFIDMPLVYLNYFGEEGLNDEGIELSWLVPNPAFFQEFTFEISRGPGEGESFVYSGDNRLLYTSHLRNFWDLTPNSTLEVGLTGIAGPNPNDRSTLMGGLDVTYKWKPVQFNTYHSLTLQSEAFLSDAGQIPGASTTTFGMYALATYQLARRWFLTGRFDQSDVPDDASWNEYGASATLGWHLTEFQKIELGGRTLWGDGIDRSSQALARVIFVIGAHGAHEY